MKSETTIPTDLVGAMRIMARCDALAMCSDMPNALSRLFLSPAMKAAHQMVSAWMREAGMTPRVDEMGNLIGHFAGATPGENATPNQNAPVFLLGSHLDTVPNAGKYDGMLGVLLAIEVVSSLRGENLPFAIEVVGFSEEEGVRFRTPYLGSRALTGTFDPGWLELRDKNEVTMRDSMRDFGLSADNWGAASYQNRDVLGYFEAHIEQGPALESRDAALGVVSAIAGQSRLQLRFSGHPGHAGTQPMIGRRDALTAASEWVLAVENLAAQTLGLVATVGTLEVSPGTPNVVPGEVLCTLDVRHESDEIREAATEKLLEIARNGAQTREIGFEIARRARQVAVPMNQRLRDQLRIACDESEVYAPTLASGAGHDAAVMAEMCPCAMLFLRTPGGASHCPEEAVEVTDVALALDVTRHFLLQIAAENSEVGPEKVASGETVEHTTF